MSAANDNPAEPNDHFGLCPGCFGPTAADRGYCQHSFAYRNVGSNHWFTCEVHMTKWNPGSNLFSGWQDEPWETWDDNHHELQRYTKVAPFYWPSPGGPAS